MTGRCRLHQTCLMNPASSKSKKLHEWDSLDQHDNHAADREHYDDHYCQQEPGWWADTSDERRLAGHWVDWHIGNLKHGLCHYYVEDHRNNHDRVRCGCETGREGNDHAGCPRDRKGGPEAGNAHRNIHFGRQGARYDTRKLVGSIIRYRLVLCESGKGPLSQPRVLVDPKDAVVRESAIAGGCCARPSETLTLPQSRTGSVVSEPIQIRVNPCGGYVDLDREPGIREKRDAVDDSNLCPKSRAELSATVVDGCTVVVGVTGVAE